MKYNSPHANTADQFAFFARPDGAILSRPDGRRAGGVGGARGGTVKAAALLTETLAGAGVRVVFSLSGNQILPVYDACVDSGIRIVHVRHEAAAVFMADAWAQLTGEVGVALIAAGPGFANGLSPLYCALRAESPVLLLSGDSPARKDGAGAFQELAQIRMSRPAAKASFRPRRADQVGEVVARAARLALSGRPGPVHASLPVDLLSADVDVPVPRIPARRENRLSAESAAEIVHLIRGAKRPIVLAGPALNSSRAGGRLAELEEALDAPTIPMESPRGLNDPALGAFAEILPRADLVALVGKAPDFSVNFVDDSALAKSARIVVADPDDFVLKRTRRLAGRRLAAEFRADADLAAASIARAAGGRGGRKSGWRREVRDALNFRGGTRAGAGGKIHPRQVCAAAQKILDRAAEPVLVCDGGEFGQWAQAFCKSPVRVINGLAGSVGGALCHAVGAKIARPSATVVAMSGDGAAGFYFSEFDTAARENAALTMVVGNDFGWNAERQIQLRDYGPGRMIGCALSAAARYDLAAAGLGGFGERVRRSGELAGAFARALACGKPACLNVEINGAPAPVFRIRGSRR